jgi:NAD(P)-dependent dehydrogenase (short-subunit alcohol dehydrogenase family)
MHDTFGRMTSDPRITDWKTAQLDDLAGKTYLITGGNSGVGYEAAAHLRRANADVLIACRSAEKGKASVSKLKQIPAAGSVDLAMLDLASLESIHKANASIRALTDGLDAVINNAGIMQTPEDRTADGFELQFGTNHLGHFMLNYLTFDLIRARSGRIVPVSSLVHHREEAINFDDPMLSIDYSPNKAYSQSKLANLMYGLELARRLEAAGSDVISASAHPGYAATNLQSTGPTGIYNLLYKISNPLFAQSAKAGAVPEVLAAAGNEARNGGYYGPTRFGEVRGPVGDSRISKAAKDEPAAKRLWSLSEELLDITWEIT